MSARKGNNPAKRAQMVISSRLTNLAMVFYTGNKFTYLYSISRKGQLKMTPQINQDLMQTPWMWTFYHAVLLRHPDGTEDYAAQEVELQQACTYNPIADAIHEFHLELLQEVESAGGGDCVLGCAWIAVPRKASFNDDDAIGIFRQLGAYEYLAKWEADNLGIKESTVDIESGEVKAA